MKLTPLGASTVAQDLSADHDSAAVYGGLRAGQEAIYVKQLLRSSYLPYSAIVHAFLRCEEVVAKMCCGSFQADQIHLVLVEGDGTQHQLHLEGKGDGDQLLELIAQRQPQAKIGYYPSKQGAQ